MWILVRIKPKAKRSYLRLILLIAFFSCCFQATGQCHEQLHNYILPAVFWEVTVNYYYCNRHCGYFSSRIVHILLLKAGRNKPCLNSFSRNSITRKSRAFLNTTQRSLQVQGFQSWFGLKCNIEVMSGKPNAGFTKHLKVCMNWIYILFIYILSSFAIGF